MIFKKGILNNNTAIYCTLLKISYDYECAYMSIQIKVNWSVSHYLGTKNMTKTQNMKSYVTE